MKKEKQISYSRVYIMIKNSYSGKILQLIDTQITHIQLWKK